MKGKLAVVGEHSFTMGFLFAGVDAVFTINEKEADDKLNELLDSEEYAVIFASEALSEHLNWRTKKRIEESARPVVIFLPSLKAPSKEGENINALIKRALGFDITK